MNREGLIEICDKKVKLIRAEYSFSQERMAYMLGISKKTLVEIEKGRSSLGWTGSLALCALFGDSEVFTGVFGENPFEIAASIAFEAKGPDTPGKPGPSGKNILWQTVKESLGYRIQQNVITQHYRLIDRDSRRVASALNIEDLIDLIE